MSKEKAANQVPEQETVEVKQETVETAPAKKKRSRKALIAICAGAAVVVITAVVLILVFTASPAEDEYGDEIEYIDVEASNYYMGVVEPQQTSEISKDPERTVAQVYVSVGDSVKKGDKLFSYDTEEAENKLAKAKIELESIQNEITEYENSISQLSRQRSEADSDSQLEYTTQIQEQETNKSQAQLNLRIKQVEIENYQDNVDNAVVTSPIDGVIKQINGSDDGSSTAFMTVLMNGSFRVKGKIDETNVRGLTEGMSVIIHSRTVTDKTWEGTITKVDTSTTADQDSNQDYYGADSSDSATKYYFYTSLDSSDGLLLGEHVYIEPVFDDYDDDWSEDAETADDLDTADGIDADAPADAQN